MGNAARTGSPPSAIQQPKPQLTSVAGADAFDAQELMRHLQECEGYQVYEFFEAEKGHTQARKLKGQSAPCVLAPRRIWAEALEEQPVLTAAGDSADAPDSQLPSVQVEPPRDSGSGRVVLDSDPWVVLTPSMSVPPKPAVRSKARPACARGPPPPPKAKAKGAPGKPPQAKAKSGAGAGNRAAPPPPFGKKLHWKLLPASSLEDTIFEDMNPWGEVVPPLNREQLKRIFCPAPRAAPLPQRKTSVSENEGPLAAKGRPGQQSGQQVCLIDNKRAQNLAIALRQVSLPTDQLSEALRGMHMSQEVTADALEHVLENLLPSLSEVIESLVSYDGPVGNLRDVEKQLLPLAKLSRLKARLRTMLFSKNMVSLRDSLLARIHALRNACEQVRTSDALKHVFRTVLRVGNYLNHGVDAPDVGGGVEAKGFAVESLLKLRDFRAAQGGEFSALHVVALHLLQSGMHDFPAQLHRELREVLEPCDAGGASITDGGISNLREGVDHFRGDMDQVHCELERFPSSYSQPALAVLQQLLEDAREMAQGLEEELRDALVIAQKLLCYFGERCEVLPPDNNLCTEAVEKFFNIIREFVTSFEDCWKEVLEQPRKLRLEGVTLPGRDSPRNAGTAAAPGRERRDSSPIVDGPSGCGATGQSVEAAKKTEETATGETTMAQRQSKSLAAEALAFRRRKNSRIETLGSTRLMSAALLVQGD